MKYISCGLLVSILLGAFSLHAMESQCVIWGNEIRAVAHELPEIGQSLYSALPPDALELTPSEKLKALKDRLDATASAMHAMALNQAVLVINQDLLKGAGESFEQEVSDLRPENAKQGGRDRRYIRKHLGQLFKKNSPQNWEKFDENNTPYIPTLIDDMLAHRKLNAGAQLTLKRAKLDSAFDEEGLAEKITLRVQTHAAGVPDPLRTQIAEVIQVERGPRYYAIHAAHKWLNDDQEEGDESDDDQDENSDDGDDNDDDDEKDDDDEDDQVKNYEGIRRSKRRRISKKRD